MQMQHKSADAYPLERTTSPDPLSGPADGSLVLPLNWTVNP